MYKYYIRQVGYLYDDSHMELIKGFGGLVDGFDNYEETEKKIKKMTCERMRGLSFFRYSPVAYVTKKRKKNMNHELGAFLQSELGENDVINKDGVITDHRYELPLDLTEEQAWKVREITDLKFYELIKVEEGEPTFWAIKFGKWNTKYDWFCVEVGRTDPTTNKFVSKEIPKVFTSRERAFEMMNEKLSMMIYGIGEGKIFGTLEKLSDTPTILKSFLEKEENLFFDENENFIGDLNRVRSEKLIILNSLLKVKLAEVVPYNVEDVLEFGTEWYPFW